jgi:16S rRNA G527 N7-methylase RsmG
VAYADVLLDWIHPILKPGGSMVLYKLDTEEENAIIMMRCNKNRYDITQRHHYQLEGDETKRILRILTKHRSHHSLKNNLEELEKLEELGLLS